VPGVVSPEGGRTPAAGQLDGQGGAPGTGTENGNGCHVDIGQGLMNGCFAVTLGLWGLLTLQMFSVHGIEIHRAQQHLREAALGDQVGNGFARIGEKDVGTIAAQHMGTLFVAETSHGEHVTVTVSTTSWTFSPKALPDDCSSTLTVGSHFSVKMAGELGVSKEMSLR